MRTPLLSVTDLTHIYGDGTRSLEDVNLEISKGERIALAGENGSGKTTLCKHLNGLLRPTEGQVTIGNKNISELDVGAVARKVGFLFQNPDHQIFCSKVVDEITFGLRNIGLEEGEISLRAEKYLRLLGLEKVAQSPPMMLSLGLRRLVTIASTLAMEQELIILDEPTAWLDANQMTLAIGAIEQVSASDRTIIVVSHSMKLLAELTDRTIVLSHGKKVAEGNTRSILSDVELLSGCGLSPTPITQMVRSFNSNATFMPVTVEEVIDSPHHLKNGGVIARY